MNNVSFNTIAFCVLATGLIVLGLNILAEGVFHVDKPEKAGMVIEVAEAAAPAEQAAEEEEQVSIDALMAAADPDKGLKEFKKCTACHTSEQGGKNKIGPNLWDIVERNIATGEGFSYSDSLTAKASETWSYEALSGFLTKPDKWAKGTKMKFSGIKSPEKRADLIAYLRSLSASPKPLPGE